MPKRKTKRVKKTTLRQVKTGQERGKKVAKKTRPVRKSTKGRVLGSPNIPLFMIGIGLTLMALWALHAYIYHRSLALSRTQAERVVAVETKAAPLPVHIFIPWNTDASIEPLSFAAGQWGISDTRVTYLLGSARPGEKGNIIMYGHNKREILGNIRALKGGERITIRTEDGKDHVYTVKVTKEVEPTDVSLLSPTKDEVLTLYTCSGFWDSKRFIVQARP